ncbi:MAG: translation elongation factor Ts [Anaerovibrio sp.]|uniref:translation elongation factor Ts n=1 Tax=Anaerovibrio sp. TaxID=1872532 RepID=UPI0025D53366|nr:translation elongation factor Ts [Anaerovibrio sp.]MCR5175277.1 translation elongation factor Ts [Anaerovibrio sp.]
MAQITAALVKELRELTGAGMMDCKKALVECDGDKDKAIDYLREKGISKAAKKAGRIASEGVVASAYDQATNTACLVEVNSETDFVAKNDNFKDLVKKIANHIIATKPADLDALNASMLDGKTVADVMTEAVASIGEKLSLRRFVVYTSEHKLATYIHMGGKIGVVVELTGGSDELAQDVALQITAQKPTSIDRSGVDPEALAHERSVLRAQALEEGKPEAIVDKMVDGRINKYYKEVCLVEQEFFKSSEHETIQDILGSEKVLRFTRFEMGEGLEKKNEDFAAEVAAQMK